MSKILIVGYGDIAARFAVMLAEQGHIITGVRRRVTRSSHKNINFVTADICQVDDLAKLNIDYDVVYFMATPDARTIKAYQAIYVKGLANVLDLISSSSHPPHFFFISSTGVYGQYQGEWVDENSVTDPERETAKRILAAEKYLRQNYSQSTVVRFSGIYGPGRNQLLKKLASKSQVQKHPVYFTNRIHQDDCAGVLSFLFDKLTTAELTESCYLASDDEPASIWDVMSWLAEYSGMPSPQKLEQQSSSKQNKRCRNHKLKQLGYRFSYPNYRAGYQALIDSELN